MSVLLINKYLINKIWFKLNKITNYVFINLVLIAYLFIT